MFFYRSYAYCRCHIFLTADDFETQKKDTGAILIKFLKSRYPSDRTILCRRGKIEEPY